jgi:hypothetical protein
MTGEFSIANAASTAAKALALFDHLKRDCPSDNGRIESMLTNKAKYALRAMIDLAAEGGHRPQRVFRFVG